MIANWANLGESFLELNRTSGVAAEGEVGELPSRGGDFWEEGCALDSCRISLLNIEEED